MIFKSKHSYSKEIEEKAISNLLDADCISSKTIWRFIRNKDFLNKLSIEKQILTDTQKLFVKIFESKILNKIDQMRLLQIKSHP